MHLSGYIVFINNCGTIGFSCGSATVSCINTWNNNSWQKVLCLGEAKMVATTIDIINSFSIIFPSYLLFFTKTTSETEL